MRKFLLFLLLFSFVGFGQTTTPYLYHSSANNWTGSGITASYISIGALRHKFTFQSTMTGNNFYKISNKSENSDNTFNSSGEKVWSGGLTVNTASQTFSVYGDGNGGAGSFSVSNGKYYTLLWADVSTSLNSNGCVMETSNSPVTITSVTCSPVEPVPGQDLVVTITTSAAPSDESIYLRYTNNGWSTSSFILATGSSTSWTATIPGSAIQTAVQGWYYAFTTTIASPTHENADMVTINYKNKDGENNYPFPVELSTFSAKVQPQSIQLSWQTATEINNAGFEIQKSSDKNMWSKIGFVAGAGNSNAAKNYSFVDKQVQAGTVYYRLKQIDNDGTFDLSKIVEASVDQPVKFELGQNYPNPFNPSTQISYSVAKTSAVKISLFNALGQQVKVLENTTKDAGFYTITVNATDLSSGVYYYKLEAGSFSQMKKMVVLK